MFHQINELMVLGMHPASLLPPSKPFRPLDETAGAPDALPVHHSIVRAEPDERT